jgi:2-polyprenyl-3-methyl-5-hydroxy-6-metoxy-1,4-benzoquinol methylase
MNSNLFARSPLFEQEGIPVFSNQDFYTKNYTNISADHVEQLGKSGVNPFMDEQLWKECENVTMNQVNKKIAPGQRILDVGVGLGRLLEGLPQNVYKFGMDITFHYLKEAQKKGVHCIFSRIEDMPFLDEQFDMVVCTDVLEHVFDLHLCVTQILRVLKKGGYLVIRVPYKENLQGYLLPSFPYEFAHVRTFEENGLRLMFEKIHHAEVMEWETCGIWDDPSRLKWGANIPLDSKYLQVAKYFINKFINRVKKNNLSYYRDMLQKTEIAMVIRKPK